MVLAYVGFGLLRDCRRGPSDAQTELLVRAVGNRRLIEPRLTGGFAYGPLKPFDSAEDPENSSRRTTIELAASTILRDLAHRSSVEALTGRAIAHLVLDEASAAVDLLRTAARQQPADGVVLSNLAAALVVRGDRQKDSTDLVAALDAATRAVTASPVLAEAHANKALTLERLSLLEQATLAWRDYLRLDADSGWAREARDRIDRLRIRQEQQREWQRLRQRLLDSTASADEVRRSVAEFPQEVRQLVEDDLLPRWGAALVARESSASTRLSTVRVLAATLDSERGDSSLSTTLEKIDETAKDGRTAAISPFAEAVAAYGNARMLYERDRVAQSREEFARVVRSLKGTVFERWAELHVAIADYWAGDLLVAKARLTRVLAAAIRHREFAPAARCQWMLGLISASRGDFGDALLFYRQAADTFARAGDDAQAHYLRSSLIAQVLDYIGDDRAAWDLRVASFPHVGPPLDVRRIVTACNIAALAALRRDSSAAALAFQSTAVAAARTTDRPGLLLDSLLTQTRILHDLDRDAEATQTLDEVEIQLQRIVDSSLQRRFQTELTLARGRLEPSPARRIPALRAAIDALQRAGLVSRLPLAHLLLGQTLRRERDDSAAADAFLRGIDGLEETRATARTQPARPAFTDESWPLYAEMIALQIDSRTEPVRGLDYAERSRTGGARPGSISVTEMASYVEPGTAMLYYAALPDRLICWRITTDGIAFHSTPVRAGDLGRLVDDFVEWIGTAQPEVRLRPVASRLYELVVPSGIAPSISTLVIVPDGPLHRLPFAALFSERHGEFLIQRHRLLVSSSAMTYVALSRQPATNDQTSSILAVGDPAFSAAAFPRLSRLRGASAEALGVARGYARAVTLTGSAATAHAFLTALGQHEVVHFAGHALPSVMAPESSQLLLAPDVYYPSGAVTVRDLTARPRKRTRLVVLAACGTATGIMRHGDGVSNLVRPFLEARVPAVVATLWNIDDEAVGTLFRVFHADILHGESPVTALRNAQRWSLAAGDPWRNIAVWASVAIYGADARANRP